MLEYIRGDNVTYTFIGSKNYVNRELNKVVKSFSPENIVRFDLDETNINDIIQELNTVSLFGQKLVIVNNIDKLDNTDILEKYLSNQSDNVLILLSEKELDKRKKITKFIKEKTDYREYLNYNIEDIIKENTKDFKISPMAINLLISYCSNDINRVENELEKLKTYKFNEKEIVKEDIESLVKKSLDSTIFDLIDKINQKDKDKIFKVYNELIKDGETEEKIMYTIANHYRLLFQISEKVKSLNDAEIIKEYKMHPYRLTKLKEQINVVSQNDILKTLKRLSEIDIGIKKGQKDIKNSMFLFFESL